MNKSKNKQIMNHDNKNKNNEISKNNKIIYNDNKLTAHSKMIAVAAPPLRVTRRCAVTCMLSQAKLHLDCVTRIFRGPP